MRFSHAFFGVFVSENSGTGSVEGGIVVGVVEVPVGVDRVFEGSIAEAIESFLELWPCGGNEIIDDKLAVGAVEHNDVSAGSGKQSEIVDELLGLNGRGTDLRAKRGGSVGGGRSL